MQVEKRYEATIQNAAAEGYAATGVLSGTSKDRVSDTIAKDAYAGVIRKGRIPALFAHDHDKILGVWENIRLNGEVLIGDLKIAATDLGNYVKALIEANVPLMNSIGFRGKGEKNKDGGVHFTDVDIYEASVVAVGAHPQAVMIAKQFGIDIAQPAHLNQQQKVALARAKSLLTDMPEPPEPMDDPVAAFDAVAAEARAYLVGHPDIDPMVKIEVTFRSNDFEVSFNRRD